MRRATFALVLASALIFSASHAQAGTTRLLKADAADVVRALEARELPGALTEAHRAQGAAIILELRAHKNKKALASVRAFVRAHKATLSPEALMTFVQWTWREGVLGATPGLFEAADRMRFEQERRASVLRTIAELRAASTDPGLVITPITMASKTEYLSGGRGDVASEQWVRRDSFAEAIHGFEVQLEEVDARLLAAKKSIDEMAAQSPQVFSILATMTRIAVPHAPRPTFRGPVA